MGSNHPNSWESWEKCLKSDNFKNKVWRVARFFYLHQDQSFTDRQVKEMMLAERTIFTDDMNEVRPKITSLIDKGFLVEDIQDSYDKGTKREVRLVRWQPHSPEMPKPEQQGELFSIHKQ